jgi:uncharacterized repeat protein (TIGR01451 family)
MGRRLIVLAIGLVMTGVVRAQDEGPQCEGPGLTRCATGDPACPSSLGQCAGPPAPPPTPCSGDEPFGCLGPFWAIGIAPAITVIDRPGTVINYRITLIAFDNNGEPFGCDVTNLCLRFWPPDQAHLVNRADICSSQGGCILTPVGGIRLPGTSTPYVFCYDYVLNHSDEGPVPGGTGVIAYACASGCACTEDGALYTEREIDLPILVLHPAIDVEKTANVPRICAGDPDAVTYTYTVTNTGTAMLGDVMLTDSHCANIMGPDGDGGEFDGPPEPLQDRDNDCEWDAAEWFDDANGNGQFDQGEPYTDANCNGQWDGAESFTDLNRNGMWDRSGIGHGYLDGAEPYTDSNGNGEWDAPESYMDSNCNGRWDPADQFVDANMNGVWDGPEPFMDDNCDGLWNPGEPLTDGNGNCVWDTGESFVDMDNDGMWDPPEPFIDLNMNCVRDLGESLMPWDVNRRWDPAEAFVDANGNGMWDAGEPLTDSNGNGMQDPGETWTYTCTTTISATTTNTATVTAQDIICGNTYSDSDAYTITVHPTPQCAITGPPGPVCPGVQNIMYTVTETTGLAGVSFFCALTAGSDADRIECVRTQWHRGGRNGGRGTAPTSDGSAVSDSAGEGESEEICLNAHDVCDGSFTIHCTVTHDATGCFSTCTLTVDVDDNEPPTITCPGAQSLRAAPGACSVALPNLCTLATIYDNCGYSCTQSPLPGTHQDADCITRAVILTATDVCGNIATCAVSVTVEENDPPTCMAPASTTVACNAVPMAPLTVPASDVCDPGVTSATLCHNETVPGNCPGRYTILRRWCVMDRCGNSTNCQQVITVDDTIPPDIMCPPAVTVDCPEDVPPPDPSSVWASDNCGPVTIEHVDDDTSPETCPRIITRTYRAIDACQNISTCTQIITVDDRVDPVLSGCPGDAEVECEVPFCVDITVDDNCDELTVHYAVIADPPEEVVIADSGDGMLCITFLSSGTAAVTATAVDACGNDASCAFTLTADCPVIPCRLTGGGNDEFEDGNSYTFGGQAGAPTAEQPQPCGEWTHRQHVGPAGRFTFHAGTASAPPETEIDEIVCDDPGPCTPSGNPPSPAKQIDFQGVGAFRNIHNPPGEWKEWVTTGSLHWFSVHIEDLGEPGSPDDPGCAPEGHAGDDADCECPDFYRFRIHATIDPDSIVLYEVFGYLDGGNFQIHQPTHGGGNCGQGVPAQGGDGPPGDLNHDGAINALDLFLVLAEVGTPSRMADLDGNGIVDQTDVETVIQGLE